MAKSRDVEGARPSIHSVAAYAGVSIATVSKVMQGVPTVRQDNVVAVQNAIEALGYRINPLAAELRRGQRKLIGAIVPNFEDPFLGRLVSALERHAEMRGYALATTSSHNSDAREVDLVNRMQDWRVAGLIVVPVHNEKAPASLLLKDSGLPSVFVDRVLGNKGFDVVSADYSAAIDMVARDVVALGHETILVAHRDARGSGKQSQSAMLARAITRNLRSAKVRLLNCLEPPQTVVEAITSEFSRSPRPTAVLSFWAPAVVLALNEAAARGWRVPDDLSVFSFQAADWMSYHSPAIDTLQQPVEAIAGRAVEILFRRMEQSISTFALALEAAEYTSGSSLRAAPPL